MNQILSYCLRKSENRIIISIKNGLLHDSIIEEGIPPNSKVAIITDETVNQLYGESLKKQLSKNGFSPLLFSFPAGEEYKNGETKERIENAFFENGFGRDTFIFALGGGVVSDLAGFIAATYCRGVPFSIIPTTLMGMIDAAIGGKVGINNKFGKNLIGSIYQPQKILIDPIALKTLPEKEIRNGCVEAIKHGLIADSDYFDYLENNQEKISQLDKNTIKKMIFHSCLIKTKIVEKDENEKGERHILNFGHTIGHAIEKLTNYLLSHGEAVAIGLLCESYLSMMLGFLDRLSFQRIENILLNYQLPLKLPYHYSVKEWVDALNFDKKALSGNPRFVLINKIGSALPFESNYCTSLSKNALENLIKWMNYALYCD